MNIAIFSQEFPILSETFIIDQVVGLLDRGANVEVITLNCPENIPNHKSIVKNKLLERTIDLSSGMNKWKKIGEFIKSVTNILFIKRKFNMFLSIMFDQHLDLRKKILMINAVTSDKLNRTFDNIIVHFGDYGYFVYKLKEVGALDGKVSIIFHGYEMSVLKCVQEHKNQYKELFKKADLFLPISELWMKKLIGWGCSREKICVQHMGVDVNSLINKNRREKFSGNIKLIQVGRLVEKKAVLDSISAVISAHKEKGLNIEFSIIGDGPLLKDAQMLIEDNNASYIKLLGSQPHEITKEYLKSSDVFILPSVKAVNGDMEGIPVALMEAMVSGLIVISTRHSGIPELVTDKVNGYLVDEHSPRQIAEVLAEISHLSETDIEKIRFNAFQKVNNEFNNDKLYDQLINLICQS